MVILLQFFFVRASILSYVPFVLSLFLHHLSFFWCLGKAMLRALRKHAYSNILKLLPQKKRKFLGKKFWYFLYFCSKHRLLVLVRTASVLTSTHNLCVWSEIRKIMYTHANPNLSIYKWGLRGSNYIGMFSWWIVAFPRYLHLHIFIQTIDED